MKIRDYAYFTRGVSYQKSDSRKTNESEFVPILRANNIVDNRFCFDDLIYVPKALVDDEQMIFKGDIVITMSSGSKNHVGKIALATRNLEAGFGAFCGKLKSFNIYPAYLAYLLQSQLFRKYIEQKCKGTNINNIRQNHILDFEFDAPPLPEQERIVAKIEELFSQLDAAVAELTAIKEKVEIYRQAVLKEALDVNGATKRICRIIDFAYVQTGATPLTSNAAYYGGTIPWVSSGKVNEDQISTPSAWITELAVKETNCKVFPAHTILVAMYGEGKTRGKCAELMIDAATNQALAAITLKEDTCVIKDFLLLFLKYNYQKIRQKAAGGVQPNLNLTAIKNIVIPLFDRKEQERIVMMIEEKLSVCDEIERIVDYALLQAAALRQAILKQAFEGNL